MIELKDFKDGEFKKFSIVSDFTVDDVKFTDSMHIRLYHEGLSHDAILFDIESPRLENGKQIDLSFDMTFDELEQFKMFIEKILSVR